MPDIDPAVPPVNDTKPTDTAPPVDVDALTADRDKWQALSKKHEKDYLATNAELEKIRTASMSDAEKAIADAKAEGRQSALSEVGDRLTEAELKLQAAKAGVDLPDNFTEVLNFAKLSKDGQPDPVAIANVIGSLSPGSTFPRVGGIGPQHGAPSNQVTEDQLKKMTHAEVNQARRDGRLNNLLGIE